jgi:putative addiction module component (TIGR02574 family)
MATPFESLGIDRLSVAERIVLVQQIWDSIAIDPNQLPLTEAQRQELERRADDDDVNPGDTVPWEQVKAEALARWAR